MKKETREPFKINLISIICTVLITVVIVFAWDIIELKIQRNIIPDNVYLIVTVIVSTIIYYIINTILTHKKPQDNNDDVSQYPEE